MVARRSRRNASRRACEHCGASVPVNMPKAVRRGPLATLGSLVLCLLCVSAKGQTAGPSPQDHFSGVNARGDQGMGFSHEKTTHHFHLLADGGAIEIQSNEPTDAASQEAIRQHLAMIAVKFAQGDFDIPMFIHATVPPGVETMKRLKDKITYQAENTTHGAQLRITTHDTQALAAIHSFLRFQIQEHQTGNSLLPK